jgi:hypothetical protein
MGINWFFKCIICIPLLGFSQYEGESVIKSKFRVELQNFVTIPYELKISRQDDNLYNDAPIKEGSTILGTNLALNYFITDHFAIRLVSGIEKINSPQFYYIPTLVGVKFEAKENDYKGTLTIDYGIHQGENVNQNNKGNLLRLGIGGGRVITKHLVGNTELIYSHQYIEPINDIFTNNNYSNLGIRFGIEIY